ncbi:MAG: hypothetical protein V1847_01235 [Candidatus Diapherotrites archaeon]
MKQFSIQDLKANSTFESLSLEIVSVGEPRAFASRNKQGSLQNVVGKDSKGKEIRITLWNDQIRSLAEGEKIEIQKGWCSEYNGQLQISTGREGKIEKIGGVEK